MSHASRQIVLMKCVVFYVWNFIEDFYLEGSGETPSQILNLNLFCPSIIQTNAQVSDNLNEHCLVSPQLTWRKRNE